MLAMQALRRLHTRFVSSIIYVWALITVKDIMGTIGHNLMVWAEANAHALWFMVGSHDRLKVRDFWQENKANIDDDNYFMPIEV